MSGTQSVAVGNKGRVVIPSDIRKRRHWVEGTVLVTIETDSGVLLAERSALETMVRNQLSGKELVQHLIDERRDAAIRENEE